MLHTFAAAVVFVIVVVVFVVSLLTHHRRSFVFVASTSLSSSSSLLTCPTPSSFVIIRRRCIALFCCDIRWNREHCPCQGSHLDFHHDACLCDSFWWFDYVRQPRTREISWD